jgi:alanine racemase
MFNTSVIELSPSALKNNLRFIRKRMRKGQRLCSVIKGNAYGHGFSDYIKMSIDLGVDYFGVHAADEAYRMMNNINGKEIDIFIMGAVEKDAVEWAVENSIEFAVFDFYRMEEAVAAALKTGRKAKVHLEIETGMGRTGFEHKQFPELIDFLRKHDNEIIFQGLFTHYAGAESQANHFRIVQQIEDFKQALDFFALHQLKPVYHHTACSAVLLNYPGAPGNMVRVGILQYGFWPNKETHIRYYGERANSPDLLRRIIKWKTEVMAVKEVKKGSFIGYGTSFLAHHNMKLAILPVGYSHGYSRNLSNVGSVLINGKISPVVGTVNMNSITVDITHSGDVKKGDEVVLIGKQRKREITVGSFSEQSNQLNYEMLTRLPLHIPRVITE